MKNIEQRGEITFRFIPDTRPNSQGKVKIYLRFYRRGNKIKDYNTGIWWDRPLFDTQKEIFLPRFDKDSEEQLNNIKINHMKSILNRLSAESFLMGKGLTVDDYLNQLQGYSSAEDFVHFVTKNNNYEYNKDIIQYATWRRHRSSLNRLIEFWGSNIIPIHEITLDKIKEFDAYWRSKKKKRNTITGYHKDIKKQLAEAVRKNIIRESPYDHFSFSYVDGNREALDQDEVKALMQLFYQEDILPTLKEVLRRFLFSCLTGLRISDTHQITDRMIQNGVLKYKPVKGSKYGKHIALPLPKAALSLIEGRKGKLFEPLSDKHINFLLKIIAAKAQIEKNLTYHCARDTFGTIFVELGGDIKTLKELMGHTNIKTTEIYLKMSDKRKVNLMNNFDQMFG